MEEKEIGGRAFSSISSPENLGKIELFCRVSVGRDLANVKYFGCYLHQLALRSDPPDWRAAGLRQSRQSLVHQLIWVSVQCAGFEAGFKSSNINGMVGVSGCTFCENRSLRKAVNSP